MKPTDTVRLCADDVMTRENLALISGCTYAEDAEIQFGKMSRAAVRPPGIISAAMLGLGRALGETMVVAMVLLACGPHHDRAHGFAEPRPSPATSLERLRTPRSSAINASSCSIVHLFVITLVINSIARFVINRRKAFSEPTDDRDDRQHGHRRTPGYRSACRGRRSRLLAGSWLAMCAVFALVAAANGSEVQHRAVDLPRHRALRRADLRRRLPGRGRSSRPRTASSTSLVLTAFIIALLPLISLLFTVVVSGAAHFDRCSSPARCNVVSRWQVHYAIRVCC